MGPNFANVKANLALSSAGSVYAKAKPEAFFMITLPVGYVGPKDFEVWAAPEDENAPAGVCRPDLTKEAKFQYSAPTCQNYVPSPSGDLLIRLTADGVAGAAGQIEVNDGQTVNVRIPMCPGFEYFTVKPVGPLPAGVTVHMINSAFER